MEQDIKDNISALAGQISMLAGALQLVVSSHPQKPVLRKALNMLATSLTAAQIGNPAFREGVESVRRKLDRDGPAPMI